MRYLVALLFEVALTTYCIVDVVRHEEDKPHGLQKVFWILILLFFPYVPDLVWLYLQWGTRGPSKPRPSGPRAPDDDPEYLRWLAEQQRRREGS